MGFAVVLAHTAAAKRFPEAFPCMQEGLEWGTGACNIQGKGSQMRQQPRMAADTFWQPHQRPG